MSTTSKEVRAARARAARGRTADLPAARIGITAGLVGILCCVGPAVLALIGVLGATAAADLADGLYGGYAWYFRGAGILVGIALVAYALRTRGACNLRGALSIKRKLLLALLVAVATYAALHALTSWLGRFAA